MDSLCAKGAVKDQGQVICQDEQPSSKIWPQYSNKSRTGSRHLRASSMARLPDSSFWLPSSMYFPAGNHGTWPWHEDCPEGENFMTRYRVARLIADVGLVVSVPQSCPLAKPLLRALLPSALEELSKEWNSQNPSQPNPGR